MGDNVECLRRWWVEPLRGDWKIAEISSYNDDFTARE